MDGFLGQIISSALIGGLYFYIITLATIGKKDVYDDKVKLSLKNSNTARWIVTSIVFAVLSLIIPTILFMIFWNNRNQDINPYILNIVGIILAAIIAHLTCYFMKNLAIKSAKSTQ